MPYDYSTQKTGGFVRGLFEDGSRTARGYLGGRGAFSNQALSKVGAGLDSHRLRVVLGCCRCWYKFSRVLSKN